ncbi:MAG: hypothetical protein WCA24_07575 [Thiomonas sp.]
MRKVTPGENEKWATVLGRILIAFGNIEHAAVSAISACTNTVFATPVSRLDLQQRLQVLDSLLCLRPVDALLVERWREVYGRIEHLRQCYRNAIAHGAPAIHMFGDKHGKFTVRLTHASVRLPRKEHLEFEELKGAAVDCEQAHLDMAAADTEIFQELALRHLLPEPQLPKRRRSSACDCPERH